MSSVSRIGEVDTMTKQKDGGLAAAAEDDAAKMVRRGRCRAWLITASLLCGGWWAAPGLARKQPEAERATGLQDIVVTAPQA